MRKYIYLSGILISFSQIIYTQSYPLVTIEDIQYQAPDSLLLNGDQPSPLNGDTVRVQGVVMVRPVVDPGTDRRPIFAAGTRWMIYMIDPNGNQYEFFDGIIPIQHDTTGNNQNTFFDLVDTADVVEFTVVVEEFFTTTQAGLLLDPVTPVSIVGNLGTRPAPIEVDISEFDNQGTSNVLAEKYEGMYVIIRNAISSDRDLSNGTFRLNDGSGNSILMYDQSGYFTLRSHRLDGITDYQPPVDGSDITFIRGFIQTHSDLGIRIAPAYPGDISVGGIISDSIKVLIPNGGEQWMAGSTQQINWFSIAVNTVKIEYSTDSGVNWQTVIEQLPNNNFYDWIIPNTVSVDCKVRISNQFNPSVSDISDNVFIILPPPNPILNIISPNGGENWAAGSTQTIIWNDNLSENVKIELYKAGVFYSTIIASTPSDGLNDWDIPFIQESGIDYKVKITSVIDSSIFAFSDDNFTIIGFEITIISPNGGENWQVGSNQTIRWTDNLPGNVRIFLYKAGSLHSVIENSTSNDGFFSWDIPFNIESGSDYRVNISSEINGSIFDFSDEDFTLSTVSITVTSPNGGEVWPWGSTQDITWSSINVIDVKIELSLNNGASWSTIIDSTLSIGIYSWLINPPQPSNQALIRISDVSDENIVAQSDDVFTIDIAPSVDEEFSDIPGSYKLLQNYPNPFNPSTTIYYGLPEESSLKITIYDVLGNEVIIYSEEKQSAGYHKMEFNATEYRSGVYFYRLQAGNFVETKKMVLMK